MNNLNLKIAKITNEPITPSRKFHSLSSINRFPTKTDPKDWPKSWKTILFKSYPRLPSVRLPKTMLNSEGLFKILAKRKSTRKFSKKGISLNEISKLLYYSCGVIEVPENDWNISRRAYPSAGARYPLEAYLVAFNTEKISQGIYHYNIKNHSLELLLKQDVRNLFEEFVDQEWLKDAGVIIVITAVLSRSLIKYGERAYRYCLIEAGHIAQNIYLATTALHLNCCAIGGFNDEAINKILDLDSYNEFTLYILGVGK